MFSPLYKRIPSFKTNHPRKRKKPEEEEEEEERCVTRQNAQSVGKPHGVAAEGTLLRFTTESQKANTASATVGLELRQVPTVRIPPATMILRCLPFVPFSEEEKHVSSVLCQFS